MSHLGIHARQPTGPFVRLSPLENPEPDKPDETITIGASNARATMTAPTKDNHANIAHSMLGMASPGLALPWHGTAWYGVHGMAWGPWLASISIVGKQRGGREEERVSELENIVRFEYVHRCQAGRGWWEGERKGTGMRCRCCKTGSEVSRGVASGGGAEQVADAI